MIKIGKQMKLDLFKNYKVSTGTVDNKNPKSMYLTISAWGNPKMNSDINYSDVIRKMNKEIKSKIYDDIDRSLFDHDRSIIDLDMRDSGINYNKKSYMNCEITLFKLNSFKIQDKRVKNEVSRIVTNVISEVFEKSEYFDFYKNKK